MEDEKHKAGGSSLKINIPFTILERNEASCRIEMQVHDIKQRRNLGANTMLKLKIPSISKIKGSSEFFTGYGIVKHSFSRKKES